jgi:hypothetical protein
VAANKYYWRNPEQRRAECLAWYYANRERVLARWKQQRAEEAPEEREVRLAKRREYSRQHRLREKARAIQKAETPEINLKRDINQ